MQNLVITKKGRELMAKLIAGDVTAEFTKVKTSDYNYSSVALEDLTDLYQIKQSVSVSQISRTDMTTVEVQAAINNREVNEGYYVRAVGLYAKSSDNGEFLYAISISKHPDYMPPFSGQTVSGITFKLSTKVDNSTQVLIEVDPAASVTTQQLQDVIGTVTAHDSATIHSEQGVHGFRLFNETLQFYNAETSEWVDATTGGSGFPPSNVINPRIKAHNRRLTIYWEDPEDTVIDGQTVCTWKGTKLVQKVGSFPENVKDGILLIDNQEKNKYRDNGFDVNNLNNGTMYYFQLFPYSDKKTVNENPANRLNAEPVYYRKMTAIIDLSNSNPATCVTYADNAEEMVPGSADWDVFFGHYPCLFKDHAVVGRLNPNNFEQFEDGTPADISSGNAGDAMIAFPRRGVKISTSGNLITVSMTDEPDSPEFKYYAHTKGSHRRNYFYLGIYKGYYDGSKLRSLSGKAPTTNRTLRDFRHYAQVNGPRYAQSAFYQLVFRQVMYLLKYKHLNSQVAVGKGYVSGNSAAIATGGTNAKGMDFGETTGKLQMKLFGIEDFWGNYYEWVDGICTDSSHNILVGTEGFNNAGVGYTNHGKGAIQILSGYMKRPQGTTETGFILKEPGASETTYFCDYAHFTPGKTARFGSAYYSGEPGGIFLFYLSEQDGFADSDTGSRLMYL